MSIITSSAQHYVTYSLPLLSGEFEINRQKRATIKSNSGCLIPHKVGHASIYSNRQKHIGEFASRLVGVLGQTRTSESANLTSISLSFSRPNGSHDILDFCAKTKLGALAVLVFPARPAVAGKAMAGSDVRKNGCKSC